MAWVGEGYVVDFLKNVLGQSIFDNIFDVFLGRLVPFLKIDVEIFWKEYKIKNQIDSKNISHGAFQIRQIFS